MNIFLNTAEIDEIRTAARWGVLDGVTTNPSLYAKVGGIYHEVLAQTCQITPGPVSARRATSDSGRLGLCADARSAVARRVPKEAR